jgi:hypothetical protein
MGKLKYSPDVLVGKGHVEERLGMYGENKTCKETT